MNTILIGSKSFDNKYVAEIISHLHTKNFDTELAGGSEKIETIIRNNARIAAVLLDLDDSNDILDKIRMLNEHLPVFLLKTDDVAIKKFCFDSFDGNVHLIDCCLYSVDEIVNKIQKIINDYIDAILPPLTKALFNYVKEGKYTFCTPGHMGGTAYQKSPAGSLFYDFFGENTMKSDISVSVGELGSLLDHSGPHAEAEKYIAETFNADRSYIVTNGTSTANKIVGQFSVPAGCTALIDRNCHKSLTHMLMMSDIIPIYLKPTRNAYGILGGSPERNSLLIRLSRKWLLRQVQHGQFMPLSLTLLMMVCFIIPTGSKNIWM